MAECKHTASERAMNAAVDMEIHAACSTSTVGKARALDAHFPAYDEMLETLKEVEDTIDLTTVSGHLYDRVIAAIAKAEGSHD